MYEVMRIISHDGLIAFSLGAWLGVMLGALVTIYIKATARKAVQ